METEKMHELTEQLRQNFYFKAGKTMSYFGLRKVIGEEAMYTFNTENCLEGIVILHVDDFHMGGNANFHEKATKKIQELFAFGKLEEKSFLFTGMDIQGKKSFIEANQNAYRDSLETFEIDSRHLNNTRSSEEL